MDALIGLIADVGGACLVLALIWVVITFVYISRNYVHKDAHKEVVADRDVLRELLAPALQGFNNLLLAAKDNGR